MSSWFYETSLFLTVRSKIHKSQITNAAMQFFKQDYDLRIMSSFNTDICEPHGLINTDETAVYLNWSPSRIEHKK